MSQRAGTVLIVIIIILLNLYFMSSGHGGRGQDYYETQTDADYMNESP
ncbi:hypothetical protein GXP70_12475 [Paenibacillus lycopersici]|uniref:Uncharacterized protein n=1 Tax=Paenibacillus lycopersici TaxID=2704462 RepID=A0A6C0G5Z0_9BACL|nr:hypothetical protein [Paenibacillus lycopersici]QHT60675.1 hypothetical protein GXP70_12475 [Paenibacillus lycopersici]